jgi:hypothetical protein
MQPLTRSLGQSSLRRVTASIIAANGENDVGNAIAKTGKDLQLAVAQANALLPRVNAGDKKAQGELRQILDGHPEIWLSMGNLASQAEQSMILVAAGDNAIVKEAIERGLAKLRQDLGSDDASPLERLLVNRVVASWLYLHYAEANYYQTLRGGMNWGNSEHHQRQIDRAQRRYLAAIRTLATVRRLLMPAVQVNIAEEIKQINVAR